ncbi:MAG: hypothetical protein ABIW50_09405, partial [Candidatus Limnocylindria bacterium]
ARIGLGLAAKAGPDALAQQPMSRRWTTWLAWGLWVLTVALFAGALSSVASSELPDRPSPLDVLTIGLVILAFPTVGAIVASRRPGNPIGWIFCTIGLSVAAGVASFEYALYVFNVAPSLPGATFVAWLGSWTWFVGMGLAATLMLLLFPDGRPPSPRWRIVGWLSVVLIGTTVVAHAVRPGLLDNDLDIPNPFGITGPIGDLALAVTNLFAWPLIVLAVASFAALVSRFVRARGDERQQLKWVAYAAGIMAVGITASLVVGLAGKEDDPAFSWVSYFGFLGLGLIPVAAGIGILRYRLYDIDLLINRTLVYAVLSATLGAVYVGSVILLQGLLSGFTGGNSLAVAASTLAVAALFQPVRRRIQNAVDRRFYRSRYDAARTVAAFASRLRHEVDLDSLTEELRGVVDQTMRPASVSVWLRARQ